MSSPIVSAKEIAGKRGLLVQVPPTTVEDPYSRERIELQPRYFYGACRECGLCSRPKKAASPAFNWLLEHLQGHAKDAGTWKT